MCDICRKDPHDSRCPHAPEPQPRRCPACKGEPERFYLSRDTGEIVGCELCLMPLEWWQLGGNYGEE